MGRNLRLRVTPVKPVRRVQAMGEHVAYFKPPGFLSISETGDYPYCGVLRGLISGTIIGKEACSGPRSRASAAACPLSWQDLKHTRSSDGETHPAGCYRSTLAATEIPSFRSNSANRLSQRLVARHLSSAKIEIRDERRLVNTNSVVLVCLTPEQWGCLPFLSYAHRTQIAVFKPWMLSLV